MEELDLEKEQRRERLGWVFYGVGAMLFVICGFYMQERVEQRVLHAYGLTVLCYGALIYVEEFEHLPFHPGGPKDPMAPADGALERTSETIPFCYVRS